jgi:hypothetical protein
MDWYMGLPSRTYVRTRAWTDDDLDAACERLRARGWMKDGDFTPLARDEREAIGQATDRQVAPALDALGDDLDELVVHLDAWGTAVRNACGYISGPVDLWPGTRD